MSTCNKRALAKNQGVGDRLHKMGTNRKERREGAEDAEKGTTGAGLAEVWPELLMLATMGVVLVPLGLWVFARIEAWAKRTGKLKRTG